MALRLISPEEVKDVLKYGKVIKEYSDDKPNPSRLILSTVNGRPLHVLAAYANEIDSEIIVTAYEPNLEHWSEDFSKRRK